MRRKRNRMGEEEGGGDDDHDSDDGDDDSTIKRHSRIFGSASLLEASWNHRGSILKAF